VPRFREPGAAGPVQAEFWKAPTQPAFARCSSVLVGNEVVVVVGRARAVLLRKERRIGSLGCILAVWMMDCCIDLYVVS